MSIANTTTDLWKFRQTENIFYFFLTLQKRKMEIIYKIYELSFEWRVTAFGIQISRFQNPHSNDDTQYIPLYFQMFYAFRYRKAITRL